MIYSQSSLEGLTSWKNYRKITITKAVRISTPFICYTREGPLQCDDGYLAIDAEGYPYPIDADVFERTYKEVLKMSEKTFVRILCIDFDGVLHSYNSGWKGADIVHDPPVEGAIEWLIGLVDSPDFDPQIYSSRSRQDGGIEAMKRWLENNGMPERIIDKIKFPTQKPAAFLTIDDRAICFKGYFPSKESMINFKPWNKR